MPRMYGVMHRAATGITPRTSRGCATQFTFQCVYCLCRERWFPDGETAFSVDHLRPHAVAPEHHTNYDNLVYACCQCNAVRGIASVPDPTVYAYASTSSGHGQWVCGCTRTDGQRDHRYLSFESAPSRFFPARHAGAARGIASAKRCARGRPVAKLLWFSSLAPEPCQLETTRW